MTNRLTPNDKPADAKTYWGSIKGFLFVHSGAGQDWRIDRAGGESMGPARQPASFRIT